MEEDTCRKGAMLKHNAFRLVGAARDVDDPGHVIGVDDYARLSERDCRQGGWGCLEEGVDDEKLGMHS